MTIRIKLTKAQISALECRGLEYDFGAAPILEAWKGDVLEFEADDADVLFSAITEEANGEDAAAEELSDPELRRFARGACAALSNLASKVLALGAR